MAIYKKDGTVLKLRGPNPLTKDQNFWEDDDIVVYNFDKIKGANIENTDKEVKKLVSEVEYKEVEYKEPPKVVRIPKPQIEITKFVEPEAKVVEEVKIEEPKSLFRQLDKNYLNCLPADVKIYKDELYGETRTTISYDKPFKFQAVILSNTDMMFEFWTTVNKVTYGSVIYHPEYRRWWKVDKISDTQEKDGFIMSCKISEIQPDFT